MKRHKLDPKFQKQQILSEVQSDLMDSVNQEVEDLQH